MDESELQIVYQPLDEVARWPRNPKLHDHNGIEESVTRFGYVQPLVRDEKSGLLVAGHGRLETLQRMRADGKPAPRRVKVRESDGVWLVPVLRGVSFESEREAELFLLADNRLNEIAGWDQDMLLPMLSDLSVNSDGVEQRVIGWSEDELAVLRSIGSTGGQEVLAPNMPSMKSIEEKKEGYEASGIRQAVLHFSREEYVEFNQLADQLRSKLAVDNNAALMLRLLREYDAPN